MAEPSEPSPERSRERLDLDEWFRGQGLPTFVPLRRWGHDLPRRITPIAVYLTVLAIMLSAAVYAFDQAHLLADLIALGVVVVLLVVFMVLDAAGGGALLAWAARLAVRNLSAIAYLAPSRCR